MTPNVDSASCLYNYERTDLETLFQGKMGDSKKANHRALGVFKSLYGPWSVQPHKIDPLFFQEIPSWYKDFFDTHASLPVRVEVPQCSDQDGAIKFLVRLHQDQQAVEAVLIPEKKHLTLCLSTQVGCAQACRFCQTGRMGLTRNLTTGEIISQYLAVEQWRRDLPQSHHLRGYNGIQNVVYMGMGEPLDNLEAVLKSTKIFCDPQGLGLSHNKVTVSTVGLLPALKTFLQSSQASLALSVHSPFDEERSRLIPANQRHPLKEVLKTFQENQHEKGKKRTLFVQYLLLRGVNDTPHHAAALAELMKELPVKINLIPMNEHAGSAYRRPEIRVVTEFQKSLKDFGLVVTIRLSKGRSVQGGCGQLATSAQKAGALEKSL